MSLDPIKFKDDWLTVEGRRFREYNDALNSITRPLQCYFKFSNAIAYLKDARRCGYLKSIHRVEVMRCLYHCLKYKHKEHLVNQIMKIL